MKKLNTQILCAVLSLQLIFGSAAMNLAFAQKSSSQPETSPAAFLLAVQEEGEALFGKDGPAYLDENSGKIIVKNNSTTSAALNDDEKKPNSLNTIEQIKAFLPRAKKAQEIYAKLDEKEKKRS